MDHTFDLKRIFLLITLLLIPISFVSAQYRSVGLYVEKHMADVVDKSLSKNKDLIATISYDKTLKIWDYPSMLFRKSINLPEDEINEGFPGICRICPYNSDLIFVTERTGSSYAYKDASYLNSDENVKPAFSFYVIDWKLNKYLGKFGALTSPITDMFFSDDSPYMIVTSEYENVSIYDVTEMRLLNSYTYDDEKILAASFVGRGGVVVITDMYYYRYELSDAGYLNCVSKRNIRTGFLKTVPLSDVLLRKRDDIAFLFGHKSVKSAIRLSTGEKLNVSDYPNYEYTTETLYFIEQCKYIPGTKENGLASFFEGIVYPGLRHYYQLIKREEQIIPDSLFIYRNIPSPKIFVAADNMLIHYSGEQTWCFSSSGIEQSKIQYEEKPSNNWKERYVIINNSYDKDALICRDSILFPGRHILLVNKDVVIWKGNQRMVLPAIVANGIHKWVNPHHFLVSLKDGTIKWYNSHSLTEELSLFITNDGEWLFWLPDGRYNSSSDKSGNMIEWKYRRFSQVETRKPKDDRRLYFRPEVIDSVIEQLFDNNKEELEYVSIAEKDVFFIKKMNASRPISIDYGVSGYDPIENGPYEVYAAYVGDNRYDVSAHNPGSEGGSLIIDSPVPGIPLVEFKGRNSMKTYSLEAIDVNHVYITCLGVSEYLPYGLPSLKAPIKDAFDVAILFNEAFSSRRVLIDQQILYDSDVQFEKLRQRTNEIMQKSQSNSLSIFYFSGHGEIGDEASPFYFVSGIGERIDVASFIAYCGNIPGYKLFIIDACFSGLLKEIGSPSNTALLWSCGRDEPSLDGKSMDRSPYTDEIITYISSCIEEGVTLSLKELEDHLSNFKFELQRPSSKDNINYLIIVK